MISLSSEVESLLQVLYEQKPSNLRDAVISDVKRIKLTYKELHGLYVIKCKRGDIGADAKLKYTESIREQCRAMGITDYSN